MRSWLVPALLLGACRVHPDYSNTHYRCDDGVCPSGFTCIAGQSNVDYWIYFGKAAPTAAMNNGATVFDFYDPFNGTAVDTNNWALQGTPAPNAGDLVLKPADSIRSTMQYDVGRAFVASLTG